MDPEVIKWVLGAAGAGVVAVLGGVASLLVVAYRIGKVHHEIEQVHAMQQLSTSELRSVNDKMARVALLEGKVDQLEESVAETRRGLTSIIPAMRAEIAGLQAKIENERDWRKSQGEFR